MVFEYKSLDTMNQLHSTMLHPLYKRLFTAICCWQWMNVVISPCTLLI